jgi:CheY-like chemotaxis protein/anti-sigma regulatory factor (Ser/Thr protein kinase)
MSELLLDDESGELTKEQRECAENIQRSANGLLTVINDILDFSKVESGRLDIEEVQFDLSVVIRDVNRMLSFAAERKGLAYIAEIADLREWRVMGDPGRLRQVMTNLLTNSIKFTTEGSVKIIVNVLENNAETVKVQFTVEDTGIGIEEEVRQKLFKPFSQADSSTARRFGGTGLGLTISKNLVELMHGEISLESRLGVGTRATFWVPFSKVASAYDAPLVDVGVLPDRLASEFSIHSRASSDLSAPTTPTNITGKHTRGTSGVTSASLPPWPQEPALPDLSPEERKQTHVLVVEDNAVNQQIALKTIQKLGFDVRAVWNGKEAVDLVSQPFGPDNPRPDVILMDVQMPILDGYRATYTIRNSRTTASDVRNTPIVAMTASAIQGDKEKCQAAGMDDYLSKPVKKPNLERMLIKWAIEGKRKRAEQTMIGSTVSEPQSKRPVANRAHSSFVSETSTQSPQDHLASELDRLEAYHRHAIERSSEAPGDIAIRRQEAEEKAISLRDDLLLESAEDPKTKLGRGVSDEHHHNSTEAGQALTTENMQKFGANDRTTAALKRTDTGGDDESVAATAGDSGSTSASLAPRLSASGPSGGAPGLLGRVTAASLANAKKPG